MVEQLACMVESETENVIKGSSKYEKRIKRFVKNVEKVALECSPFLNGAPQTDISDANTRKKANQASLTEDNECFI